MSAVSGSSSAPQTMDDAPNSAPASGVAASLDTVASRLAAFRLHLGLKQREMADALEVPFSTYQKHELGPATPKAEQLHRLAELGCDLNWLFTGSRAGTSPVPTPPVSNDTYSYVPRYDIAASAGPGAFTSDEQVIDRVPFRTDWIRRSLGLDPRQLVLVTARGDSMFPTVSGGDLLLVDTHVNRLQDDAVYVIGLGDGLHVKRLQAAKAGVLITSDNPRYAPLELNDEEASTLRIAGRVRWVGHTI